MSEDLKEDEGPNSVCCAGCIECDCDDGCDEIDEDDCDE